MRYLFYHTTFREKRENKMKIFRFFPGLLVLCLLLSLFPPCALALDGPELTAQAVLLADLDSGAVLYEQNSDVQRSPASLTKIMTVLLALEAVERGEISLEDPVTAGPSCRSGMREDSSSVGIVSGETMSLRDLLYCAAVASGNDACNVIAVYVAGDIPSFVLRMNRKAESLGCTQTHFVDPHGLSYDDLTCARDLFRITLEAMSHPGFMELCDCPAVTVAATNKSPARNLKNSNALISTEGIYGDRYLYEGAHGVKTGYTRAAGYCLISTAERNGMRLLAVVLGSDGPYLSNTDVRYSFVDSARLYDWAFGLFRPRELCAAGQALSEQRVSPAWGDPILPLLAEETLTVLLPDGAEPELCLELEDAALRAPIAAGQLLGRAVFLYEGEELGRTALVAGRSIDRNIWAYVVRTVKETTETGV